MKIPTLVRIWPITPILVVVVATFIIPLTAFCQTPLSEHEAAALYNKAGTLYGDGHYEESLAIYENLISQGIDNPDLLYNAANASYRTGSTGKAVVYLERARRLAPSDRDILSNLAYLNRVKTDQEPESDNAVTAFITRRYHAININAAALWSGVTFALAMLFLTASVFAGGWKRLISISAACMLILVFFAATGVLIHKAHRSATTVEAVIMTEEASAYSGPGIDNTHIFTIHEGTKVTIERSQDGWNLIRLSSGAGGWITADAMEIL